MNAKTAVFILISLGPSSIKDLIARLPYSERTIYRYVEELVHGGLLERWVEDGNVYVTVTSGYRAQKLREIHVNALINGIDPEILLRSSTISIWTGLSSPKTVKYLEKRTGLSGKHIRKILNFLDKGGLIEYKTRNPILVVHKEKHPINKILKSLFEKKPESKKLYFSGETPFEETLAPPEKIERMLYECIDQGVAVKNTGFLVQSKDNTRLRILESVNKEMTVEEIFLNKLMTTEGVEDQCIYIVRRGNLDYDRLFELAKRMDIVNIVGCYLDILHSIEINIVSLDSIEIFYKNQSRKKKVFLNQEKRYGKSGHEKPFEEKWNIDLYIDIDAIRHGVRSL